MKKSFLFFLASFGSFLGISGISRASILPPNDLYLQDDLNSFDGITEKEFSDTIDYVVGFYVPLVSLYGARFEINKLWQDPTVNAGADQPGDRKTWQIFMYGGLARRPEATLDGFALVICHELGHHFAGYPFYPGAPIWGSSEGQSDYFATQSCARTIWKNQVSENEAYRATVGRIEKSACDLAWTEVKEQNLCYRIAAASQSLANILASLEGTKPKFETPDTKVVRSTKPGHPAAQCRLDTYLRGSVCKTTFEETMIPGLFGQGSGNSVASEKIAIKSSCSDQAKNTQLDRPSCWFKSLVIE